MLVSSRGVCHVGPLPLLRSASWLLSTRPPPLITLLQAAGGAGVLSPTPLWFSISFSKAPLILAFVSGRPEPFGAGCDTVDTKTLSHDGSLHTDTKHQAFVHKLLGFYFFTFLFCHYRVNLRNLSGCFSCSSLSFPLCLF